MSNNPQRQPPTQHHHRGPTTAGAVRSEPEVVRIGLLGGFHLSVGPRLIEEDQWRLRKARSLIKLLALAPALTSGSVATTPSTSMLGCFRRLHYSRRVYPR